MVPVGCPDYLPNAHLMAAVTQWHGQAGREGERERGRETAVQKEDKKWWEGAEKKRSFCFLVDDPDRRAPTAREKREKALRGEERKRLTLCAPHRRACPKFAFSRKPFGQC